MRIRVDHDHKIGDPNYSDQIARMYDLNGRSACLPVTFQVTEDCNLCCTYCYQINKSGKRMDLLTAQKAIDRILDGSEYFKDDPFAIVLEFIGGEPLLEIGLIEQIYKYFLRRCVELNHDWLMRHRLSMCSNGVLYFSKEFQDFLRKYSTQVSLAISLDGTKDQHDACRVFPNGAGSYDIAVEAARHYRKHYGKPGTKMTISPGNVHRIKDSIINLWSEGFDYVPANCVFEPGWEIEHARELYRQLIDLSDYCYTHDTYSSFCTTLFSELFFDDSCDDRNWCGGTGKMIAVDYRGTFYPCLRYMPSSLGDKRAPIVIGDVDSGICCTEDQKCLSCMMSEITASSQSTEECIQCPIKSGCAWCSAYNYQETGDINKRVTHICIMHKARALANVYYWNKFYEKHNVKAYYENYCPDDWAVEIIGEEELARLKNVVKLQKERSNI